MPNDIEHLFMCLLAISRSSFVKYLFKSIIFMLNFLSLTTVLWLSTSMSLFIENTQWKVLEVKDHSIRNLFSNGSEKNQSK